MKTGNGETCPSGWSRRVFGSIAGVVFVVALVGCNESPTRPGVTPIPVVSPKLAATVRLEVGVPAQIAPGGSVQLTARAVKSDGSSENVTDRTTWTSSNPRALEVSGVGVARGVVSGEAAIIGRFDGRSASAGVLVLPEGTYRLIGRVSVSGVAIRDVLLTVVSGVGANLTATSSSDGGYAFYGVSGPIRIQAKKEGFVNRTESVDVRDHQAFDLGLDFDGMSPALSGVYTLTLAAAPCLWSGSVLPEAARSRSYSAHLTQAGFRLDVTLSDADFIINGSGRGNRFAGFVEPSGAVTFDIVGDFDLTNDPYYVFAEHDVAERLGSDRALLVSGLVTAQATASRISGLMKGMISVAHGTKPPFDMNFATTCRADAHSFELQRR